MTLVVSFRSLGTSQIASVMEKREYLYKILVIGDNAVGKSSIVKRYVHNFFTERYKATVSFHLFLCSSLQESNLICYVIK